ncbi:MAG: hypothetical protein V3R66_06140 [Rhodospirillales bacterium]
MNKQPQPVKEKARTGEAGGKGRGRAEIFTPGDGGGSDYKPAGKGGVASSPSKAKAKPAPKKKKTVIKVKAKKKTKKAAGPKTPSKQTQKQTLKPEISEAKPSAGPAAGPTPASQSQALAEAVTSSLLDRLREEAKRKGGTLTIKDLEGMNREFQEKAKALQVVFEKSFEEYVLARERSSFEHVRQYPFDRVIVKSFSHLFADDKGLLEADDTISRRILPGFFMAFTMMLGPDLIEVYQEQCRKIVDRIKKKNPGRFEWESVYDDGETEEMVLDAQVAIALNFKDMEKRGEWFIEIINNHLAPLGSERNPDEAVWRFTPMAFKRFIGSLLSDLNGEISTEGGRMRISKRHGVEVCVELAEIIKQFEASI